MTQDTDTKTVTIKLGRLHCVSCATNIALTLEDIPGVLEANADYARSTAVLKYNPAEVSPEKIIEAIKKMGYEAEVASLNA